MAALERESAFNVGHFRILLMLIQCLENIGEGCCICMYFQQIVNENCWTRNWSPSLLIFFFLYCYCYCCQGATLFEKTLRLRHYLSDRNIMKLNIIILSNIPHRFTVMDILFLTLKARYKQLFTVFAANNMYISCSNIQQIYQQMQTI